MRRNTESGISELQDEVKTFTFNWLQKVLLIISAVLVLVLPIIATIIINIENSKLFHLIGNLLLIVTYMSTLIVIGTIAAKNYRISKLGLPNRDSFLISYESFRHQLRAERALLIINTMLTLLGIGEAVFDLTKLADVIVTIVNKKHHELDIELGALVTSMFENGFKCIYHLSLLAFIMHHRRYEAMFKCLFVRIFFYALSLSCITQWFFIILQEISHDNKVHKHGNKTVHSLEKHSVTNSTDLESFSKVEQFLFPLGIEFRISLFIELFPISLPNSREEHVFFKKAGGKLHLYLHKIIRISKDVVKTKNVRYFLRNSESEDALRPEHSKITHKHTMIGHFCMFASVLVSIILVSISIVIIFFQVTNEKNMDKNGDSLVMLTSEICETTFMFSSGLYVIFLLFKIIKKKKEESWETTENEEKTGCFETGINKCFDFAILLVSQFSLIVYSVLTLIGSAKKSQDKDIINKTFIYFTLTTSIVSIFQSILQTICIRLLCTKTILHRSYIRILILLNFGIWLFDTFSAVKHETSRIQRSVYTEEVWEKLCLVFIPLSIFYRIHTTIVLIKLNAKTYERHVGLVKH